MSEIPTQTHSLAAIASIIHDCLMTKNFTAMHRAVEAYAGRKMFSHDVPRWLDEHMDEVRQLWPALAELDVSPLKRVSFAEWQRMHPHLYDTFVEISPLHVSRETPAKSAPDG